MMMRPGDILGRIFFILSQKSIIGIYPRNYFGSCFARNLWGKSSLRCCFARNIVDSQFISKRNL